MIENKHQHDVVLVVPNGDEELRINFHGVTPTMMPLIHALDAAQDMLAALDDIVQHIHMDAGMQRRAQDAVAKARGFAS